MIWGSKIGLFSSQIEMNSGFERNDEKNDVYNKLPLKKIKEALWKCQSFKK